MWTSGVSVWSPEPCDARFPFNFVPFFKVLESPRWVGFDVRVGGRGWRLKRELQLPQRFNSFEMGLPFTSGNLVTDKYPYTPPGPFLTIPSLPEDSWRVLGNRLKKVYRTLRSLTSNCLSVRHSYKPVLFRCTGYWVTRKFAGCLVSFYFTSNK